jgi:alkanesulfonate monooxygenase SsuD/methylene tetrahydromethanopterin reductase-like flavin-dependent oxidoreductase (luciferase family)
MTFTLLRRGELIAVPPPDKALEFLANDKPVPGAGPSRGQRRAVVGTPAAVRSELEDVAAKYGADEVIAVNILYDHQARRRSYELLAGAFAQD